MKVVCAYCGTHLGYKDGKGVEGTSHGVCISCFDKVFVELDELKRITYYHIKVPGQDEPIKHVNLLTDKQKEILSALEVKL